MLGLTTTIRNAANGLTADRCANPNCASHRWRFSPCRRQGVRVNDLWCCSEPCVYSVLLSLLGALPPKNRDFGPRVHRLPLGLLMLSRKLIDEAQLRAAIEMQRVHPSLKIGACMERLGWITAEDITRLVAAQHAVPLLYDAEPELGPVIPVALLRAANCAMFRARFDQRLSYLGFDAAIDTSLLAAASFVLCRRFEPCIVSSQTISQQLEFRSFIGQSQEVAFETAFSVPEVARTLCSYAARMRADSVRCAATRANLWVKITGARELDLTFRWSGLKLN